MWGEEGVVLPRRGIGTPGVGLDVFDRVVAVSNLCRVGADHIAG